MTKPTANICIKKNRTAMYQGNVYLKNGTEFEIELYNPTSDTVLAKIEFNGKPIDGGIILRPAERVYLERYITTPKKFVFETYMVDDTDESKDAIADNGKVVISFYRETKSQEPSYWSGMFKYDKYRLPKLPFKVTLGGDFNYSTNTLTSGYNMNTTTRSLTKLETGMVGKGSDSSQVFKNMDIDFDHFTFHSVNIKLMPISLMNVTSDEIKVRRYCSHCGSKISSTDKYCAQCGERI